MSFLPQWLPRAWRVRPFCVGLLEAKQCADALDGGKVVVMPDRPKRAAVGEGLMNGEIQARIDRLQPSAVQWTVPLGGGGTTTGRADPGRPVRALLEEQQVDSPI